MYALIESSSEDVQYTHMSRSHAPGIPGASIRARTANIPILDILPMPVKDRHQGSRLPTRSEVHRHSTPAATKQCACQQNAGAD